MKQTEIITELEQAVQNLGLTVRYEKGDFKGGDCILYDQSLVVLGKKMTDSQKISVLARVVGLYGGEEQFLKPVIRQVVEDEMARYREQLRQLHPESTGREQ